MKLQTKTWGLAALLLAMLAPNLRAQNFHQTLKGVVVDKKVREPLPGARVFIGEDNSPLQGITDSAGRFRIPDVPVGYQSVRVQYLGYQPWLQTGIAVNSGKETELLIELEERILTTREAVIGGQSERFKPLNPLAAVSARSFSVEETQRYAAAANDPARMASAFAGVAVPGDDNNTIVIRGNAPNGLLWRLEGVDIPNPNHFANVGATGGAISVLSAQVLAGSDFFTGAFPAEYGNALSGVFDLKLRKGNAERREYTVQAGLLGLEGATEGPLNTGKQTGSYLFNYRFSSLYVLSRLGVDLGDVRTKFQDLSFHTWLPVGRLGELSLFGIGGISAEKLPGQPDSIRWRRHPDLQFNSLFRSDMGVLGLSHQKQWGNTFWKQVLAWSGSNNVDKFERYDADYTLLPVSREDHQQKRLSFSSVLSHKVNTRHFFRAGAYATLHHFQLAEFIFNPEKGRTEEVINSKGRLVTLNAFAQWQYRPADKLSVSAGLHTFFFFLNRKQAFEPRASLEYALSARQSLHFGFGFHAQMQPIGPYFTEDSSAQRLNPGLGLTKAQHSVLGYRLALGSYWQLKTEVYYQYLYRVPVSRGTATSYSIVNDEDGFTGGPLANNGQGRNYGLEISLERPLANGLYALLSTSLYRSKYRASDGLWRNTRYNGNCLNQLVAGKEWGWTSRKHHSSLALNLKFTQFGGLREAPINLAASGATGFTIRDEQQAFKSQLPAYWRLDLGLRLKRQKAHTTATFFLDVQNVTNRQNARKSFYDPFSRAVGYEYQEGLIPIMGYKLEF